MELYVKENYGKISAIEIAKMFDVKVHKIYGLAQKLKLKTNKSRNKTFEINFVQEQIFLSGRFGDGNFRKMGNGAIYREKHALDEKDYCLWKKEVLGDIASMNKPYYYKDLYVNFDTSNSKQLLVYKDMENNGVIEKLQDLGLLLYFLDDGWTIKRSGYYAGYIASAKISHQDMKSIAKKYEVIFGCNTRVSTWQKGKKDECVVIYIKDITSLIEVADKYNMQNLDIYKKKFLK